MNIHRIVHNISLIIVRDSYKNAICLLPEIDQLGNSMWRQDGKLGRDWDLPAIIFDDNTQEWWRNGEQHRDYGLPAVVAIGGYCKSFPYEFTRDEAFKQWWVNGKLNFLKKFNQK